MTDRTELSEAIALRDSGVLPIGGYPDGHDAVIEDAARRFLALMPDEDGNHDPELVERGAKAIWQSDHNAPEWDKVRSRWDQQLKDEYRDNARAVLRAVTVEHRIERPNTTRCSSWVATRTMNSTPN